MGWTATRAHVRTEGSPQQVADAFLRLLVERGATEASPEERDAGIDRYWIARSEGSAWVTVGHRTLGDLDVDLSERLISVLSARGVVVSVLHSDRSVVRIVGFGSETLTVRLPCPRMGRRSAKQALRTATADEVLESDVDRVLRTRPAIVEELLEDVFRWLQISSDQGFDEPSGDVIEVAVRTRDAPVFEHSRNAPQVGGYGCWSVSAVEQQPFERGLHAEVGNVGGPFAEVRLRVDGDGLDLVELRSVRVELQTDDWSTGAAVSAPFSSVAKIAVRGPAAMVDADGHARRAGVAISFEGVGVRPGAGNLNVAVAFDDSEEVQLALGVRVVAADRIPLPAVRSGGLPEGYGQLIPWHMGPAIGALFFLERDLLVDPVLTEAVRAWASIVEFSGPAKFFAFGDSAVRSFRSGQIGTGRSWRALVEDFKSSGTLALQAGLGVQIPELIVQRSLVDPQQPATVFMRLIVDSGSDDGSQRQALVAAGDALALSGAVVQGTVWPSVDQYVKGAEYLRWLGWLELPPGRDLRSNLLAQPGQDLWVSPELVRSAIESLSEIGTLTQVGPCTRFSLRTSSVRDVEIALEHVLPGVNPATPAGS